MPGPARALHPTTPRPMPSLQELAAELLCQGLPPNEVTRQMYACRPMASLADISDAVEAAEAELAEERAYWANHPSLTAAERNPGLCDKQ